MPWEIADGPYDAPWGGRDAVGWGWVLSNEEGVTHVLTVWVSGTAMAIAAEYLPRETVAARETGGRSEVERILNEAVLPAEVLLSTAGRSVNLGEEGWWVEVRGDEAMLDSLVRLFPEGDRTITRR